MLPWIVRISLCLFFAILIATALTWWWLTPQGFPFSHPKSWSNLILPLLSVPVAIAGIVCARKKWDSVLNAIVLGTMATVLAAAIMCKILFPESTTGRFGLAVTFCAVCAVGGCVLVLWVLNGRHTNHGAAAVTMAGGVLCGCLFTWTQRAANPATRPFGKEISGLKQATSEFQSDQSESAPVVQLTDRLQIIPKKGEAKIGLGDGVSVSVQPVLTFDSKSPDRFWTLFSPRDQRTTAAKPIGVFRNTGAGENGSDGLTVLCETEGYCLFRAVDGGSTGIKLESFTQLANPVYSHLNTFTEIIVNTAVEGLGLSFSPCPKEIAVTTSEYPSGAPARLAYLDESGNFKVVEASSAEKGPFTTLAEGTLNREDPLTITLFNGGKAIGEFTIPDWASQASTQLSPTAGWGLPENAIEFSLLANSGKACVIYLTLASTSVGRGFDSVGHSPGTYRNRIHVVPAASSGEE